MNPYPLSALNHFTVPVAIDETPPLLTSGTGRGGARRASGTRSNSRPSLAAKPWNFEHLRRVNALLRASLGNIAHVGATLPSGSQGQAFLRELVMSGFLMF